MCVCVCVCVCARVCASLATLCRVHLVCTGHLPGLDVPQDAELYSRRRGGKELCVSSTVGDPQFQAHTLITLCEGLLIHSLHSVKDYLICQWVAGGAGGLVHLFCIWNRIQ